VRRAAEKIGTLDDVRRRVEEFVDAEGWR